MFSKEAGQNIWYDLQKVSRVAKRERQLQNREWDRVMCRER